jgi:hypothetical protein
MGAPAYVLGRRLEHTINVSAPTAEGRRDGGRRLAAHVHPLGPRTSTGPAPVTKPMECSRGRRASLAEMRTHELLVPNDTTSGFGDDESV